MSIPLFQMTKSDYDKIVSRLDTQGLQAEYYQKLGAGGMLKLPFDVAVYSVNWMLRDSMTEGISIDSIEEGLSIYHRFDYDDLFDSVGVDKPSRGLLDAYISTALSAVGIDRHDRDTDWE